MAFWRERADSVSVAVRVLVEIIQAAGGRQKTLLVTGNAAALAQKLAAL
jgi:hypothetical protein